MPTDIPRPRSYQQILGQMLDSYTSRTGIRRAKVGNPQLSAMEAAARSDVRQSQDVFNGLASNNLDNSEGTALDRIGNAEQVPRLLLRKSTGSVTVTDTSFSKKSTKVYQGLGAPIVGSVALNVADTTSWPGSGSVYVGRNTPNVEGPLSYSSITSHGSYSTLNLTAPTTRFHNLGEAVVLAQGGNRVVDAGQVVQTPQGALASAVQFSTVFTTTIPDGETSVDGVAVTATVPGAAGNAPALAVQSFAGGLPFSGATVTNPGPFTSGRDTETDNDYRDRIRAARNSKQRGTDLAIENAVVGAFSPDESKTVTSANLVRRVGQPAILYIDDGTGYEEAPQGVGIETVIDLASGGESEFQALNRPISKAFLLSGASAPYLLADGVDLSVDVGGVVTTHSFDANEFQAVGAASAYEVVASINANGTLLWSARTSGNGTKVVLFAKAETNEDLQVAPSPGIDSAAVFDFPTTRRFTTLLYKNDRLLSKDGTAAVVKSEPFDSWGSLADTQSLYLVIDRTPFLYIPFSDPDFISAGTAYTAVGKNSLEAWAAVFNAKVPGVTTTVEGDRLVLTSNLGRSARAGLQITGGSLVTNGVFAAVASNGSSDDYSVDRGTGQIVTNVGLVPGDRLSLGSAWTRAFLETVDIAPTSLSDVDTWWAVDGQAQPVQHGVGAATPLTATVEGVTARTNIVGVTAASSTDAFINVKQGDWAVMWDPMFPPSLQNAWRVIEVDAVSFLLNKVTLEKRAAALPRFHAAACAMASGGILSKIIVTGGYTHCNSTSGTWTHHGDAVTEEVEIYDPNTGTWTAAAPMATARAYHTATLLQSGEILVVGGYDHNGNTLFSSEIYDPATNTWRVGPNMNVERAEHTATLLNNGRVLIAGGIVTGTAVTANCVEYDPVSGLFINTTTLGTPRAGHGAVLLPVGAGSGGTEGGNVLLVGGINGSVTIDSVERYNSASPGWTSKAGMGFGHERAYFGLAVVATQKVLAVGDCFPGGSSSDQRETYQVYSVDTNTWTSSAVVESGWKYQDKHQGLVKSPTNSAAIAYGAISLTTGLAKPKRFDGGSLTWSDLPAPPSASYVVERTGLSAVAITGGSSPDRTFFFGGVAENNSRVALSTAGPACATSETWNDDTPGWEVGDPALTLSGTNISSRGLTFVRTLRELQHLTIPAAANYTAPTLAAVLNAGLYGVEASVYRTNRLRVETSSFDVGDDISLVAVNDTAFPVPVGSEENVVGHFASVVAGNSGLGTPDAFQVHAVIGTAGAPHVQDAAETIFGPQLHNTLQDTTPPETSTIVGLRRWYDGLTPRKLEGGSKMEFGNTKNVRAVVAALDTAGNAPDRVRYGLRTAPEQTWNPGAPAIFATPYAIGPRDDLTVVVDQDEDTKRFATPMFRRLKPVGSYGSQVTLVDHDASDVPLAQTFGTNYDFDDFAIYMQARTVTDPTDTTLKALWRYFRHGPEGERCVLRFDYASAPDQPLAVALDFDQTKPANQFGGVYRFIANIVHSSGAARSAAQFDATSRLAFARTDVVAGVGLTWVMAGYSVTQGQRTAPGTHTRLRLAIPNNGGPSDGPQDSGISPGDIMYFAALAPTSTTLFSGAFTVEAVDPFNALNGTQDIYVPPNTLHDGTSAWPLTTNPGTVSFSAQNSMFFDPATAGNDLVYLANGVLPSAYTGNTGRVVLFGPQYIAMVQRDVTDAGNQTVPIQAALTRTSDYSQFLNSLQTVTQVVAAVNALSGDSLPSPIVGKVLGTGSGISNLASWDAGGTLFTGQQLQDGVNYIQRTVAPPDTSTNTQFLLKKTPSSSLTSLSPDWTNEDVRLVPLLAQDVVQWLNTPAATGLSSVAEVAAAEDGTSVQIASLTAGTAGAVEVQGGTADLTTATVIGPGRLNYSGGVFDTVVATVRRAEADGLVGNRWVRVDNENAQPKGNFFAPTNNVLSVDPTGRWTFDVPPYNIVGQAFQVRASFERVGDYVAIHMPNTINGDTGSHEQGLNLNEAVEYGYVYVTGDATPDLLPVDTSNQGVFRVVRFTGNADGNTIWIENKNGVEQTCVCKIKALSQDSTVPGDVWSVSSSDYGVGNRGSWVVGEVGAPTPGGEQYLDDSFVVSSPTATPAASGSVLLTTLNVGSIQVRQGQPSRLFKQVVSVVPNQVDPTLMDVQLATAAGYQDIGAAAGSVITAQDKLAFPPGVNLGVDGYSYATGLLGEVDRILYGDPAAPSTYPGYAAAGASILPSGPTVKRVKVALSLRVVSGLASSDLADRVRSAVASVVNQSEVGQSVAISDIVRAAARVGGVVAVAVVSPTYSSTSDTISVGAGEKLLVVDLQNDVSVSFVGS